MNNNSHKQKKSFLHLSTSQLAHSLASSSVYHLEGRLALVKDVVPVLCSRALLSQNSRDIFFSPNGDRTGTMSLTSAGTRQILHVHKQTLQISQLRISIFP